MSFPVSSHQQPDSTTPLLLPSLSPTDLLVWAEQRSKFQNLEPISQSMKESITNILDSESNEEVKIEVCVTVKSYLIQREELDADTMDLLKGMLLCKRCPQIRLEQIAIAQCLALRFTSVFLDTLPNVNFLYTILVSFPETALQVFQSLELEFDNCYRVKIVEDTFQYGNGEAIDQDRYRLFIRLLNHLQEDWKYNRQSWVDSARVHHIISSQFEIFFTEVSVSGQTLKNQPLLGEGSNARVFSFPYSNFRTPPSISTALKLSRSDVPTYVLTDEAHYLRRLRDSVYVINLIAFYPDRGLILEQWGMNLWRFQRTVRVTLTMAAHITNQLLHALVDLKSKNIAWLDLKPANILINPNTLQIKCIDFNLTCDFGSKYPGNEIATRWWRSPKCALAIDNEVAIGPEHDLWSAGVVVVELLKDTSTYEPLFLVPEYDNKSESREAYQARVQKIFDEVLKPVGKSPAPPLYDMILESIPHEQRPSSLCRKIVQIATGLLQYEDSARMSAEECIRIIS